MSADPHVNEGLYTRQWYTVATLPAAASMQGEVAYVTDLTDLAAGNNNKVAVGGGFNRSRVRSDGTSWRIDSYNNKNY